MRCETCQGQHYIQASKWEQPWPCPACGGVSILSCCEVHDDPQPDNVRPDLGLSVSGKITVGYPGWDMQTR